MPDKIANLIVSIINEINERGGQATKQKVLLLIYLFDVAYYREHRETFTGWKWEFNDTAFFQMSDEILEVSK